MRIYVDRRLGDVDDVISFSETLVSAQEFYPDAVDYRPDAKLPVDFRGLNGCEAEKYIASLDALTIEDELDFVAIFLCDLNSERELDFTPFLSLSPVVALEPSIDHGACPSITVDRRSGSEAGVTPRHVGRARRVFKVEEPEPDRRQQGTWRQVCLRGTCADRRNGGVRGVTGTPPPLRSCRRIYPERAGYSLSAHASVGERRVCLLYGAPCSRCLRKST